MHPLVVHEMNMLYDGNALLAKAAFVVLQTRLKCERLPESLSSLSESPGYLSSLAVTGLA